MTTQEKQIKVAEIVGWVWQEGTEPCYGGTNIPRGWINPTTKRCQIHLPDYCNSIDSIRAAVLAQTSEFQEQFANEIDACFPNMTLIKHFHQLTALDWVDCFLAANDASMGKA